MNGRVHVEGDYTLKSYEWIDFRLMKRYHYPVKTTLSTEVGLLALWDQASLSFIKTPEDGMKYLVEDVTISELMNKGYGVFWGTGGDGTYKVEVRIGDHGALTPDELKLVEIKAENMKLIVTSPDVYVGSPEYVGYGLEQGLSGRMKMVEKVDGMSVGTYRVGVYFLYDALAAEKEDDMTREELMAADADTNFNKTGFVVLVQPVDATYQFPPISLPTLG